MTEPAKPAVTDIVGYDDSKKPITRQDLQLESRRQSLDNFPFNLLVPFEGKDQKGEEKQLIDAVMEHRRAATAKASKLGPKR